MEGFSITRVAIAQPIDYLLQADEWVAKEVVTRVIAVALVFFATIDASGHFLVGILIIPLACVSELCTFQDVKMHLIYSVMFLSMAALTPLEVISPDWVTHSLLMPSKSKLANDVSGLNPTAVVKSYRPETVEELKEILAEAEENDWKVSVGGQLHAQGGHQFCEGGVFIDIRSFNKVIDLDEEKKTIRVQSGITWDSIQRYIHPHGLAVEAMQAINPFTVGGSLGVNVHGWDFRNGPLIETVKSIRVLLADGSICNASREENRELFFAAINGFGLLGIILEAEFQLTEDCALKRSSKMMPVGSYNDYFEENVQGNEEVELAYGLLDVTPDNLLKRVIAVNFVKTDSPLDRTLKEEQNIALNSFLFHLYRRGESLKGVRWPVDLMRANSKTPISRNNAMRPEYQFMEYSSSRDTDILQEYFVPREQLEEFIDGLRQTVRDEKINLLHATIRYVKKSDEALLSYAQTDVFAIVLYLNIKTSAQELEKVKNWTQTLTDSALDLGGRYYLPYMRFQTQEQFERAYPRAQEFLGVKAKYDPKERFSSSFYQEYLWQK